MQMAKAKVKTIAANITAQFMNFGNNCTKIKKMSEIPAEIIIERTMVSREFINFNLVSILAFYSS